MMHFVRAMDFFKLLLVFTVF